MAFKIKPEEVKKVNAVFNAVAKPKMAIADKVKKLDADIARHEVIYKSLVKKNPGQATKEMEDVLRNKTFLQDQKQANLDKLSTARANAAKNVATKSEAVRREKVGSIGRVFEDVSKSLSGSKLNRR